MGKLSEIFRGAATAIQSSESALLKPKPSSSAALQRQVPSPIPPNQPQENSSTKKKPTQNNGPASKPNPLSIVFESPSLSDAKSHFNSLIAANRNSPSDNPTFCSSILKAFSSVSSLQDSILFFNHMVKTHPPFSPNNSLHTLLVQSCSSPNEESLSNVHKVLDLMTKSGFPPNQVSMDVAVRSLCGCGREDHAFALVKELSAKNSPPDTCTYNFLVRHFIKKWSLSSVNLFVKDMWEFGLKPDLVTYTMMINSACNSRNLREAMRLLGVLCEEGYEPDCYMYNTIMKCYCMPRKGEKLLEVYKIMQDQGVKPDRCTYNTLIFGLSKSGKFQEAMKYFGVMTEMGHLPDIVTYTSLINGMCRQGDALGALEVYKKMQGEGVKPDRYTFNTLIFGLSKSGRVKEAIEYLRVMAEMGYLPDEGTYGSMMKGMCEGGDVLGAFGLLEEIKAKGCSPDAYTYNTLLLGLCKARLLDKAVELYELMRKGDIELETGPFGSFLRQLHRKGRVAEAKEAFDYAIASKSLTDVVIHSTLEITFKCMRRTRNFNVGRDAKSIARRSGSTMK